jgi:hypothetical protein
MVVYFGAAGSGLAYCQHSGVVPDIFVDNDSSKWGSSINGAEVLSPNVLTTISLESITITSGYIKDILPQILSLGVDRDIIHIPPKSLLGFHPFNLELNRIQAANKLHEIMFTLSDRWNVVAVGGTALGFGRNEDFIHWDNDIDLFAPIQSKPALIELLQGFGYSVEDEMDSRMKSIKSTLILENSIEIPFSVDFFNTDSLTFIDIYEDYTWEWPTKMFTDCAKVKVHGKQMNLPNPLSIYLSKVYGESWATPNPQFGHSDYAGKVS